MKKETIGSVAIKEMYFQLWLLHKKRKKQAGKFIGKYIVGNAWTKKDLEKMSK